MQCSLWANCTVEFGPLENLAGIPPTPRPQRKAAPLNSQLKNTFQLASFPLSHLEENIQQLSPARGPNIQSLSQMINDICQLTKKMASPVGDMVLRCVALLLNQPRAP